MTGSTGFIGSTLVREVASGGLKARQIGRSVLDSAASGSSHSELAGCCAVIHLAGRAHVLDESGDRRQRLAAYRLINCETTLRLARAAADAGVPRFVFVSSIKVHGSSAARPFRPDDEPNPDEPYAISKFEAELGLRKIAAERGLEVVVVRPPLVYGPGVKANLRRLMQLIALGVPLPLSSMRSLRSLVGVRNLCDLLRICIDHPAASGKTLLVADEVDITLPDLMRYLAEGMGVPLRLFSVPVSLLEAGARLAGKHSSFLKLTASLQVDATKTYTMLGWRPPVSVKEGLLETGRWYSASGRNT